MHLTPWLLLASALLVGATGGCSGKQTSAGPDHGSAGAGGAAGNVAAQGGSTSQGGHSDAFLPCPSAVPMDGDYCFLGAGVPSGERCTYSVPGCERLVAVCSMNTWQLEACPGAGGSGQGPSPCSPACSASELCIGSNWFCEGVPGVCVEVADCEARFSTVCGCDGQVYESECAAYQAGTSINGYTASCSAPPGTFPCGATFCALGELCIERYEAGWICQPLPEVCQGEPDCDCMAGAGGAGGEGGGVPPDWSNIAGDSRCRQCADDGPGLKVTCSAL